MLNREWEWHLVEHLNDPLDRVREYHAAQSIHAKCWGARTTELSLIYAAATLPILSATAPMVETFMVSGSPVTHCNSLVSVYLDSNRAAIEQMRGDMHT